MAAPLEKGKIGIEEGAWDSSSLLLFGGRVNLGVGGVKVVDMMMG